ncbi:MAG: ABC transporter permease [Candidatus Bathyarchaeota archaeon]|nr:ABC transporter permease [Candidatus Bathyarchaeota archaeon]
MADFITQAFEEAIRLILSGDPEVLAVVGRSIYVSGGGTLLACIWSIPIAVILGLYTFKGKWLVKGMFNALIGVPTVALGLLLVLLLSRQGPFGVFHLYLTTNGIMIGQAILVTPIIVSFTGSALANADFQLRDLARTLGANGLQTNIALLRETLWPTILAVTAAFNRGFGELGIAFMVGGNLLGITRVLTTSIALESNLGNYPRSLAFAMLLMIIVVSVSLGINLIERLRKERPSWTGWIIKRGTVGG